MSSGPRDHLRLPGCRVTGRTVVDGLDEARLVLEAPGLLRYARSTVGDPTTAEDLVQETLARALERGDSFRGEASPTTWLHRILHNLAVDHVRRAREVPTEDVVSLVEDRWRDPAYTVDVALVSERAETTEDLKDALLRVPFDHRTVLVLHDMEGLTVAEIARIQGVGLPAAKQRLRRGRMMLVTALANGPQRRAANRNVPLTCWDARSSVSDYLDDALPERDRGRFGGASRDLPHLPIAVRIAGARS